MAILLLVGPATFFVFINSYFDVIPFLTMERVIFASMLGLILLKDCFKKESRIRLAPVEIVMICFLIYTLLSLLTTFDDKSIMFWFKTSVSFYVQGYFIPMVSFMIARRMVWHERNIEFLFNMFVVAGAFLGVTALLQVYFGVTAFIPDYMVLSPGHDVRAVGTFTNASEYGLVLSVFILTGALMYKRTEGTLPRLAVLGCLFLMVVGLILGKTRAPWLGALLSLAFVALFDKQVRTLMLTLTGVVVASIAIVLPLLADIESLISRLTHIQPILGRLGVWVASINMMIQNPILGIGFGRYSFSESLNEYLVTIGPISEQWTVGMGLPHSEFFYIAALTGVVGLVLYLCVFWFISQILRDTYKNPSSSPFEKDVSIYMGGVFTCFIANSIFVDIGRFNYFFILMYFLFGIVASFNLKNKTHELAQNPSGEDEIVTFPRQP